MFARMLSVLPHPASQHTHCPAVHMCFQGNLYWLVPSAEVRRAWVEMEVEISAPSFHLSIFPGDFSLG